MESEKKNSEVNQNSERAYSPDLSEQVTSDLENSETCKEKNWEELIAKRSFWLNIFNSMVTVAFFTIAIIQLRDTKQATESAIESTKISQAQFELSVMSDSIN